MKRGVILAALAATGVMLCGQAEAVPLGAVLAPLAERSDSDVVPAYYYRGHYYRYRHNHRYYRHRYYRYGRYYYY